jgi:glycosyltransferase involved in cell wall biosynthesis
MKKRISIFLPSLHGGGAEKVMLSLACEFVRHNINCDLVIAISKGELLYSVPSGVRLIQLNKRKTTASTLALAKYLRRVRPNVILSTVFTANITALLAAKISLTRLRIVTCEASPTDWDMKSSSWLRSSLNKLFARSLYRHADASIAVSEGVRDALLKNKLISRERIFVIANPIPEQLTGLSKHKKVAGRFILACGRLEPQKDYITLLNAFKHLRSRLDVGLIILGEGSLRKSLEQHARELDIANDVLFAGFTHHPYDYMADAELFVHTARYEGFGIVLLEALACGCPIVATDSPGGVREVLDDGKYGALVPVGDYISLANTMESVLIGKLKFAAPEQHLKKFQLEAIADAYIRLLLPQEVKIDRVNL